MTEAYANAPRCRVHITVGGNRRNEAAKQKLCTVSVLGEQKENKYSYDKAVALENPEFLVLCSFQ